MQQERWRENDPEAYRKRATETEHHLTTSSLDGKIEMISEDSSDNELPSIRESISKIIKDYGAIPSEERYILNTMLGSTSIGFLAGMYHGYSDFHPTSHSEVTAMYHTLKDIPIGIAYSIVAGIIGYGAAKYISRNSPDYSFVRPAFISKVRRGCATLAGASFGVADFVTRMGVSAFTETFR